MATKDVEVRTQEERMVVTVAAPPAYEGVGRALRAAFRGKIDRLPPELEQCLARLH